MRSSLPVHSIPADLTAANRWVMHSNKIPLMVNGASASVTDPRTWTSLKYALRALDAGGFDGIGFVLGDGIAGVDLDNCIDQFGSLNELAHECLKRVPDGAYVEVSPSGKGLHIIGRAPEFKAIGKTTLLDGKLEVYPGRRYFTVTANVWEGGQTSQPASSLRDISALIDWLREQVQSKVISAPITKQEPTPSLREMQAWLKHIDPSDDGTWLKVGMVLKDAYGNLAWELFDEWSARTSGNNYEPIENRRRWESFKGRPVGEGVGVATIKMLARQGGYSQAEHLVFTPLAPDGSTSALGAPASTAPIGPEGGGKAPATVRGVSIAHAISTAPRPRRWLLRGFLEMGKTGVIAAAGGGSKTQFALQLALGVALGEEVAGIPTVVKGDAGSSLLLVTEDDTEEVSRRLWGIHQLRGYTPEEVEVLTQRVKIIPMVGRSVQLMQLADGNPIAVEERIEEVISQAKLLPDVRLVVLDPLARFLAGEESSNQMGIKLVEIMERISAATGAATIVTAHINKAALAKLAEGVTLSQGDVRGASAIVFNTRATLFITPPCAESKREKWVDEQGIADEEFDDIVRLHLAKTNVSKTGNERYMQRFISNSSETSVLIPFEYRKPAKRGGVSKDGKPGSGEGMAFAANQKDAVFTAIEEVCTVQATASRRDIEIVIKARHGIGIKSAKIGVICTQLETDGRIERIESTGGRPMGYRVKDLGI